MKRGEVTELTSQIASYPVFPRHFAQAINSKFGIWVDRGDLDFDESMSLNVKVPAIKTVKLKDLLEKAWKM